MTRHPRIRRFLKWTGLLSGLVLWVSVTAGTILASFRSEIRFQPVVSNKPGGTYYLVIKTHFITGRVLSDRVGTSTAIRRRLPIRHVP